ncbi:hypothetical protein DKX38_016694 [Salix brachista]|uniref:RRM domain-containing protein n=1 Tax=Salix brachista TaxID=2182728 RepID=A0A5N5LA34_9ROSI|nr:hypothetical protein DKX38_016694 [Salix brachista]
MAGTGIHPYHQQWPPAQAPAPPPSAPGAPPPVHHAPPPVHHAPPPVLVDNSNRGPPTHDEVRTIFITGFPDDVKERELQNLLRWLPGYEASQVNYKGEKAMGFALFSCAQHAIAAKDALQDMVFDADTKSVLHTEMAKKNLFVKRGCLIGGFEVLGFDFQLDGSWITSLICSVCNGIVADSNAYDQSKRLRTGGDYSHTTYTTPSPFHPPPPVWGPHGYMTPAPPPYDPYGGYPVPQVPMPPPAPIPAPSSYVPVQNTKDNPPCNTLFIGNLGENINEDELRGLFSVQPGFKQMKMFPDLELLLFLYYDWLQGAVIPSSGSVGMRIQVVGKYHHLDVKLTAFEEIVFWIISIEGNLRNVKNRYKENVGSAMNRADYEKLLRHFKEICHLELRKVVPNVFVYNVLIGGLCKDKRIRDAEKLFGEMYVRNLVPNTVTFNTLIDGYCKAGEVDLAFGLRERMKKEKVEPSIITFNSLLSGLCKARRIEEARSMLKEIESNGFVPDGFTYSIILDGLLKSDDGAGAALDLYREAIGKGVKIDNFTCSILLNGLCKEGKVEKAVEVLKSLVEHGLVPGEVIYNTIVNGYCQIGDMDKAILTIEQMESRGLRPNCIAFNSVIGKFCELQMIDKAEEWVKKMVGKGIAPSVETYNILIDGYGRLCDFSRCFQVLEEMEGNGEKPNVISYGSLINCLCKDRKVLEAEMVLRDMVGRGVLPNANIYNMLIDGCCTVGKLKEALRFFDEMSKNEIGATIVTYNALIKGLCKMGKLKEAEEMFFLITSTGHCPDVITYNSLISGYSNAGNLQKCLELYETMKKLGLKPTINTFHPLISGCSKEGIKLKETLFNEMLQINLSPDRVVYNDMIHFYQEIGHVQKAFALQQEMVDMGIRPDNKTYNSLILGHLKEGKLSETKDLVDDMKVKGLIPEADTYSLLIKGHCDLKDFNGAYVWYREMLENGFLPNVCICNELSTGLRNGGSLQEAQSICSEMIANGMDDLDTNEDLSAVVKGQSFLVVAFSGSQASETVPQRFPSTLEYVMTSTSATLTLNF